jgi:hypothetical protein
MSILPKFRLNAQAGRSGTRIDRFEFLRVPADGISAAN